MRRDQPVRSGLRAATAEAHARVDRAFGSFDLSQREGYVRFLLAQAAALLPLEQALDAGIAPELPIDWSQRKRAPALLADLAAYGAAVPELATITKINRPAAALGTIYVLEGSRLGGALLKRSVPASFPSTFLAPAPGSLWRRLLEVLEDYLQTDELRDEAREAALEAFGRFERAALDLGEAAA